MCTLCAIGFGFGAVDPDPDRIAVGADDGHDATVDVVFGGLVRCGRFGGPCGVGFEDLAHFEIDHAVGFVGPEVEEVVLGGFVDFESCVDIASAGVGTNVVAAGGDWFQG